MRVICWPIWGGEHAAGAGGVRHHRFRVRVYGHRASVRRVHHAVALLSSIVCVSVGGVGWAGWEEFKEGRGRAVGFENRLGAVGSNAASLDFGGGGAGGFNSVSGDVGGSNPLAVPEPSSGALILAPAMIALALTMKRRG